jgi:hypothetical protein
MKAKYLIAIAIILTVTDKASCGLFQTQHEASLHLIPTRLISLNLLLWGFNILFLFQKSGRRVISLPTMARQILQPSF